MIDAITLFSQLHQKLDYISVRHTLLAENVAHADTPGYSAQDLKPFAEALCQTSATTLSHTHENHLQGTSKTAGYREDRGYEGWATDPSGNNVSLEEQMIAAADATRDYQLTTTLVTKHLSMMRAALRTR